MGLKLCIYECVMYMCYSKRFFFRYIFIGIKVYYKIVVVFLFKGSKSLLDREFYVSLRS